MIGADGGKHLLESFREQVASLIMGQTMGAGNDQGMRPGGQTDHDPGNLADAGGLFNRSGQRFRQEIRCDAGAHAHERTCGTCR